MTGFAVAGDGSDQVLVPSTHASIDHTGITGVPVEGVSSQLNGGALQGPRPSINFIEGTDVTILVADNAGQNRIDVTASLASGSAPVNIQTFVGSGTWFKPSTGTLVQIRCWGGGGGGGGNAGVFDGGGGGGGSFVERFMLFADISGNQTVSIGAAGVAGIPGGNGGAGGNTLFGAHVTAYGGGGGGGADGGGNGGGGGGGGTVGAGETAVVGGGSGANGGLGAGASFSGSDGGSNVLRHWGGGGGGNAGGNGQDSFIGGGGGGGGDPSGVNPGGVSIFGGDGGDGTTSVGSSGSPPSGGGGGGGSGGGGAGAAGRCEVWTYT